MLPRPVIMGTSKVSWYLQRQGHPQTRYYLDVLLKNRDKVTIGRRPGGLVDIICNGKTVSRSHCNLKFIDDSWHVEDLQSMNGVYLNGSLIPSSQPIRLSPGDALGIGCRDLSETDYFVFTVCKAVIKDENENAQNMMLLQGEIPSAACKTEGSSTKPVETLRNSSLAVEGHSLNINTSTNVLTSVGNLESTSTKFMENPKIPSLAAEDSSNIDSHTYVPASVGREHQTILPDAGESSSLQTTSNCNQIVIENSNNFFEEKECMDFEKVIDKGEEQQANENGVDGEATVTKDISNLSDSANKTSSLKSPSIEKIASVSEKVAVVSINGFSAEKATSTNKNTTAATSSGRPSEKIAASAAVNEKFTAKTNSAKLVPSEKTSRPSPSVLSTSVSSTSASSTSVPSNSKDDLSKRQGSEDRLSAKSHKSASAKNTGPDKLNMNCLVVLKRLTELEIKRITRGQAFKLLKPRARPLVLSDDEEDRSFKPCDVKPSKKSGESKKSEVQNIQVGGTPKEDTPIPETSVPSSISSDDKQTEVNPSSSNTKFVVEKQSISSGEHKDKTTSLKPANQPKLQYTEVIDLANSDEEILSSNKSNNEVSPMVFDEIELSSDEETFSCTPRHIKSEPIDKPDASAGRASPDSSSSEESDSSAGDSSDSSGPFFPVLSQGILEQFAEEDAAEAEATKVIQDRPSTSDGRRSSKDATLEKLESILARQRSKPKEKKTIPTTPKALDTSRPHTNRRFTLATGPVGGKGKRDKKKKNRFLEKLKKDQDFGGYLECVKKANSKSKNAPIHPAPEVPKSKGEDYNKSANEKRAKGAKKSEYSAHPVIHKPKNPSASVVKITKRSRGDILADEMTNQSDATDGGTKRPSEGSLAEFKIPKRARIDGESSSSAEINDGDKTSKSTEDRVEDFTLDADISTLGNVKQPSFKPPVKRVARLSSDSGEQRESSYSRLALTDPAASKSPVNKKWDYHPRVSAIPLGEKPRSTSIHDWRRSRALKRSASHTPASSTATADSFADETLPLSNGEATDTEFPEPAPEIMSDGVSSRPGILVRPGDRRKEKKRPRLSFGDNQIREIETKEEVALAMAEEERAQQATVSQENHMTSTSSSEVISHSGNPQPVNKHVQEHHSRVESQAALQPIISQMLARICNWNYSWIVEQKNMPDSPPPLLGTVTTSNGTLPDLIAIPVLTTYATQEQYQDVFFPLMLHEIWGVICKDIENAEHVWKAKVLLHNGVTSDGYSAFVRCEALVPEASARLWEHDLMVLSFEMKKDRYQHVLGFVEGRVSVRNSAEASTSIDRKLLDSCPKPFVRVSFVLRLKPSNLPRNLDAVCFIKRLSSLRANVKQFSLVADITNSPLHKIILDPITCLDGFTLLQSANPAPISSQLNEIQSQAVSSIAETIMKTPPDVPKVALLQGPPGTGKSQVIVQLVLKLMKELRQAPHRRRILICAPSNNAVDEIALRLINTTEYTHFQFMVARVGVPSAINPKLKNITVDALARKIHLERVAKRNSNVSQKIDMMMKEIENQKLTKANQLAELANLMHDQDRSRLIGRKLVETEQRIESAIKTLEQFKEIHADMFRDEFWLAKELAISQANIICTTLNSCRSRDMENIFIGSNRRGHPTPRQELTCCIIDEASQCSEPESLMPIGLGIKKLVLIGDPDQLPATVTSSFAQRHRFEQSLFNRFFAARQAADPGDNSVLMLSTQYRMAATICEWPSKYFYGKKLVTDPALIRDGPGALLKRIFHYKVLNVHDSEEKIDAPDTKSLMNENEAKVIAGIVKVLASVEPNIHKHLGIITFYSRQKHCIIKTLRENVKLRGDVEVNTVDAYQGREKDIIIVSCVRSNRDLGFLSSPQRTNVALTRARHSLIVCGHFDTLGKNEAWRDLINDAKVRGFSHTVLSDYTFENIEHVILKKTS